MQFCSEKIFFEYSTDIDRQFVLGNAKSSMSKRRLYEKSKNVGDIKPKS